LFVSSLYYIPMFNFFNYCSKLSFNHRTQSRACLIDGALYFAMLTRQVWLLLLAVFRSQGTHTYCNALFSVSRTFRTCSVSLVTLLTVVLVTKCYSADKSKKIIWTSHVVRLGERKGAYKVWLV
jgi:hypothetical protein